MKLLLNCLRSDGIMPDGSIGRLLANVHALDEAVFHGINMLDHAIHEHFAGEFAHDLMDADDHIHPESVELEC